MGLEAIYPKPRLSQPAVGYRLYPYLLRGVKIRRPNQVWSADMERLHQALDDKTPEAVYRQLA